MRKQHSLERVHPEGHIHAGAVREEGSESRLLKQAEDQDFIPTNEHSHSATNTKLQIGSNN